MSDFHTLAIVQHPDSVPPYSSTPYLYELPEFTSVCKGQLVKVETERGELMGVMMADSCTIDDEKLGFIALAMHATLPLKRVLSVYTERKMDYKDYNTKPAEEEKTDG